MDQDFGGQDFGSEHSGDCSESDTWADQIKPLLMSDCSLEEDYELVTVDSLHLAARHQLCPVKPTTEKQMIDRLLVDCIETNLRETRRDVELLQARVRELTLDAEHMEQEAFEQKVYIEKLEDELEDIDELESELESHRETIAMLVTDNQRLRVQLESAGRTGVDKLNRLAELLGK
jgi:hypothetical protein